MYSAARTRNTRIKQVVDPKQNTRKMYKWTNLKNKTQQKQIYEKSNGIWKFYLWIGFYPSLAGYVIIHDSESHRNGFEQNKNEAPIVHTIIPWPSFSVNSTLIFSKSNQFFSHRISRENKGKKFVLFVNFFPSK